MGKPVVNIGILGLGTIGCGTVDVLQKNIAAIEAKVGCKVAIKRIADVDIDRPRPVELDRNILTTNASDVIHDPDIDIVVELIGGVEPARSFILDALNHGKHVVTANKELIAKCGHEILVKAAEKKLDFYFEGSVGGGIPIIRPLKICLAANRVQEVIGIVNGTTNYILTKMATEGQDFDVALADAQAKGYAERNPTADVEGYDAAYKLAILASIAFTSRVNIDHVYHEGITKLTKRDIEYANELGYCVKLLAIAKETDLGMQLRVHPAFISKNHPLASVNDVFNAIFVRGESVGDVMFYGRGAGASPTGSAVVGDVMDIARNIQFNSTGRIPCTCFDVKKVVPIEEVETKYYIRMETDDKPKVLATVAGIFGENNVSLASVVQKDLHDGKAEIVWVTHPAREKDLRTALDQINALSVVGGVKNVIRVEG
jgi:homoserine dehydrogenase